MDILQVLGSTLGLSFLAGMRLYATVLALGLGIRYHLFRLPQALNGLEVLAHPAVLIIAGAAFAAEFVADKVPWFDTLWDSVHTFIRPVGAALLGATALADMDPPVRVGLALLCGGVALTSHSSKAATRVVANHSPEPFSNIALSLAGDVAAPAGVWLAMSHPLIALGAVAVAVAVSLLLVRFIVRKLRTVFARLFGGKQPVAA
ncbi:MAG: DUF4126 domain-containing protein [Acidobacteria bacterium]|nr:DUF4126 domain-containing protein [Acidobacteriota bacterium]